MPSQVMTVSHADTSGLGSGFDSRRQNFHRGENEVAAILG